METRDIKIKELRLFAIEENLRNLGDKNKNVDKERHEKTVKDLKKEITKDKKQFKTEKGKDYDHPKMVKVKVPKMDNSKD